MGISVSHPNRSPAFVPQELLLAKQLDQRPDLLELSVPDFFGG